MVNEVKDGDFPAVPPSLPSALLHGYDELPGGISKSDFVGKFLKQRRSEDTGGDQWDYPNSEIDDFVAVVEGTDKDGNPIKTAIKTTIKLGPGILIDRFGADDTRYFAPVGTPYAMRSLPPCVLNLNYSVFRVLQPLEVDAGPIEPGFLQPGLGTQYVAKKGASELIKDKVIVKLSEDEVRKLYQK